MNPEPKIFTADVGGKSISFETGSLAGQAGGAVTVRLDDTMVFCAATMSSEPRPVNFFPLMVDFEERMYAGGRIPGGFFRREGRPSENAILTNRLTDRPLRPLFPKDLRNEVQVVLYAFSSDEENPLDILAINAASAAITISDIPWAGPVGAVRIGRIDGEFVVNPSFAQIEESELDLRLAGTKEAILMVECGASEVSEDILVKALEFGHSSIQPIIATQSEMQAEIGKEKRAYQPIAIADDLKSGVLQKIATPLYTALEKNTNKVDLKSAVNGIRDGLVEELVTEEENSPTRQDVLEAFDNAYKIVVRKRIVEEGKRPDGRTSNEIRPIWTKIDYSPRAHGSGIFTRGETQILTVVALGTPRDAQEMDNLTPIDKKRYIHHYNFPPFSVGETRFLRGASRREIGHGALAERALLPVIPKEEEFPYTLRLVSEALSSNGSTSMGSVCGSTLALMDAGVPIARPVSGIAMGLVKDGDKYVILSDIQGLEDHLGDMDFKVAGTEKGITALQMDIKISGLTAELMAEALNQAKDGRQHILDKMMETISVPNPELKPHTPRITTVLIPTEKIGAVIGPGGKTIRGIQEETGARIDINEDGTVFISTNDGESESRAREMIIGLTEVPEEGRIYTGKIRRIADFGAFVEILPGTDGLVHISQLDTGRVERVEEVAGMGEEITVMVTNIDDSGKVRLSRKAVLEGWSLEEAKAQDAGSSKRGGGGRGGRGGNNRRGGNRGGNRGGGNRR